MHWYQILKDLVKIIQYHFIILGLKMASYAIILKMAIAKLA